MNGKHLFICLIIASSIHASLIFSYFYHNPNNEGAIDQGKDGLVVGVGITGSYADNINEGKNNIETISKQKLEPKVKQKPESKPKPVQKPETKPVQKPKPKPEPETKPKPKPKPKTKPETKTKPVQKPKLQEEPNIQSQQEQKTHTDAKHSSKKTQTARRATGTGDQEHSGGNPGIKQSYLGIVKNRISRVKKYPRSARSEGVTGTVTVRFFIKLNGKVKKIKLIKSSGDERLDKEAMKMLKKASPFPPIPSDVSKEGLDLTLPIEFSLKTIKNKFY